MRRFVLLISVLLLHIFSFSQVGQTSAEKWDLRKCVEYALANNISIKQRDIEARISELTLKQSKASQIPSLNFQGNAGYSFGLSNNPTTGILENNKFFNSGMQLQSGVTLFNFFARRNLIAGDKLAYEASIEQVKTTENDIALLVAVSYLQALLSKEQVNLSKIQAQQTLSQLESTRKQIKAGKLPELTGAQLESQLATDSSNLITAEALVRQNLLQLKALLNLDASVEFDIVTPPVDLIPIEPLSELQPEAVYASAMANLPQQKANSLRIQSATKYVEASKAGMYPSVSAYGSISTNYVRLKTPIYDQVITSYVSSGLRTDAGGGTYLNVERPVFTSGSTIIGYYESDPLGKQFRNNFGQNIGISLSVPIFNGRQARSSWERSKLSLKNMELTKEQGDKQLKQDIYKAYNDASSAVQKFNANKKAVEFSQNAYDFAQKRFDLGLVSLYELISSQTVLLQAKTNLLLSQYDYVFKMKLLEFYKGQGLKL